MRHFINTLDLSLAEQDQLLTLAQDIIVAPEKYRDTLRGKVLASLFFEPSTRTRLSFDAAMQRLGGAVIGFSVTDGSSVTKGETLCDTVIMASQYANAIVMRHPQAGAAQIAAEVASVPIINAGDGGREHPTQTLGDLLTIKQRLGRLDNFTIGCCNDLKYGRTVHSLVRNLARYPNVHFVLISRQDLALPQEYRDYLASLGVPFTETSDLAAAVNELDVLYMTRTQRERLNGETSEPYTLTPQMLANVQDKLILMHPLPRNEELPPDLDNDPRACYFEQARCGMYMRMALLKMLI